MMFSKTLAAAIAVTCLTVTTAFAAPGASSPPKIGEPQQRNDTVKTEKRQFEQERNEFAEDPIKAIQSRKEKIQALFKEGKITKEKADEMTAKLDAKIKEIEEFNKLNVQQKKDKLIKNFKASVEKRVKEGKLTKEKAGVMLKEFTEKIEKWDGQGYPHFHEKRFRDKDKQHNTDSKCRE